MLQGNKSENAIHAPVCYKKLTDGYPILVCFLFPTTDSASLGGALRAAHGWLCNAKGSFVPFECMYKDKFEKTSLNCKLSVKAGDPTLVSNYAVMMQKRMEIENRLVEKLGRW